MKVIRIQRSVWRVVFIPHQQQRAAAGATWLFDRRLMTVNSTQWKRTQAETVTAAGVQGTFIGRIDQPSAAACHYWPWGLIEYCTIESPFLQSFLASAVDGTGLSARPPIGVVCWSYRGLPGPARGPVLAINWA